MSLYLTEATGARIFLYGIGIQQVGDDYQASFTTWEASPAGEVGDCLFRSLGLSFRYTNGYALGVTPIVDGFPLPETQFNGVGSSTNGQAQVFFAQRGTRIAASVRTLSRQGDLHISNVQATLVIVRSWP